MPDADGPMLGAVIFDVDGTLADTERDGHRPAFNAAFAQHGVPVHWDVEQYGALLAVTGGRRRIAADLRARGVTADAEELAADIHRTKTELFRRHVLAGAVEPRPGLPETVKSLAEDGIRIAIATTGRRAWVEPLVAHLLGAGVAETVVTGDDVTALKPDPQVYRIALERLGLPAENALAVEDSAIGLAAATGAGLPTLVVHTDYTRGQDFTAAAAVRNRFDGPDQLTAASCRRIHARWCAAGGVTSAPTA